MFDFNQWSAYCKACQNISHCQQQSYSGLQWPEWSHCLTIHFLLLWSSFQPPARRKPMADAWSCINSWIRIERSLYGTYHWERKGFGFPRRHWWQFKVHNLYGATQKCNNHSWWHRTLLLLLAMCTGLEVKGRPLPHLQGSYWSRD